MIRIWLNGILAPPNIALFMQNDGMFSSSSWRFNTNDSVGFQPIWGLASVGYGNYLNFQTIAKELWLSSVQQNDVTTNPF